MLFTKTTDGPYTFSLSSNSLPPITRQTDVHDWLCKKCAKLFCW